MKFFNGAHSTFKLAFDAYLRSKSLSPKVLYDQIEASIRSVYLSKASSMREAFSHWSMPARNNFFEMVRFDFGVDEQFKVYLMEVNMSPNLSTAHFIQNRLLYEQVVYNLLSLVGVASHIHRMTASTRWHGDESEMLASDRDITVFIDDCAEGGMCATQIYGGSSCKSTSLPARCSLCRNCLSSDDKRILRQAVAEHIHRAHCKRVFPPTMESPEAAKIESVAMEGYRTLRLTARDIWMSEFFRGKCIQDRSWC